MLKTLIQLNKNHSDESILLNVELYSKEKKWRNRITWLLSAA